MLVKEFDKKWFNILTHLHVLCVHSSAFWYKYLAPSKRLEFLLEHRTRVNTLEVYNNIRLWSSVCLPECWWFAFYRLNSYCTFFPTISRNSGLSGSSDIFITHKHASPLFLLNKKHVNGGGHWWKDSQSVKNFRFIQTSSLYS